MARPKYRTHPLVTALREGLLLNANPQNAEPMEAYMKHVQAYYGIKTEQRRALFREAKAAFPIDSRDDYEAVVRELWGGPLREEKYQALEVAEHTRDFLDADSCGLYSELLHSSGNWWDTVDWISTRLISPIILADRTLEAVLPQWRTSENMWVRRASLLAHIKHRGETNRELLAETILMLAPEREFFIRKAIGWTLREFSKTDPAWVQSFVTAHAAQLSSLSCREALKRIAKQQH